MYDFADATNPRVTIKQVNQQVHCLRCGNAFGEIEPVRVSHRELRAMGLRQTAPDCYAITHEWASCELCAPVTRDAAAASTTDPSTGSGT